MGTNQFDAQLNRVASLSERRHFRRAQSTLDELRAADPDSPRIAASQAFLNDRRGLTSYREAESTIRGLAELHQEMIGLRTSAISCHSRTGDSVGAMAELRDLQDAYPSERAVHIALGGMITAPEDYPEAWGHLKQAMESGPLPTPCFRSRALFFARKYEPGLQRMVLNEAPPLERASLRTRVSGPIPLLLTWWVLVAAAVLLGYHHQAMASFVATVCSVLLSGWFAFANDYMCCKKCRNAWITFTALEIEAWPPELHYKPYEYPRVALILAVIIASVIWDRTRDKSSDLDATWYARLGRT